MVGIDHQNIFSVSMLLSPKYHLILVVIQVESLKVWFQAYHASLYGLIDHEISYFWFIFFNVIISSDHRGCGVVWCGVVWCGVVWYAGVWSISNITGTNVLSMEDKSGKVTDSFDMICIDPFHRRTRINRYHVTYYKCIRWRSLVTVYLAITQ